MLTKVGYQLTGIHPRNFIITPNGKYLLVACRDSNVIQVYERDTDTGLLTDIRKDIKVEQACLHQICTVNRKKYLVSTGQKQEYAGPNQEPILPNQSDYEKPEYPDD